MEGRVIDLKESLKFVPPTDVFGKEIRWRIGADPRDLDRWNLLAENLRFRRKGSRG